MERIELQANAKINLTLDVLRKREDGYHELKMIMQTVSLFDNISIRKTDGNIRLKTNLRYLPTDKRNIAYGAAELFLENAFRNRYSLSALSDTQNICLAFHAAHI